jgi:Domain of unknown function (DUF4440)
MKRCPTCNQTFADDTLSFCLEDGTPLVAEQATTGDSEATLVSPSADQPTVKSGLPPTQSYGGIGGKATWVAASDKPPISTQYAPVTTQRRKVWPWIVGATAILFVGILGIVILAVVLSSRSGGGSSPSPRRGPSSTSPSVSASDVPTDKNQVLDQLRSLENRWQEANVKGNKAALEEILADDFVGGSGETTHTKREYIDNLTADDSVQSWAISDLSLQLNGSRAVLDGTLTQETDNGSEVYSFTDTFVWRDHRWQAVGSSANRIE